MIIKKAEKSDYFGDSCVLGGSDVRVFPDYTAMHRDRSESDLSSPVCIYYTFLFFLRFDNNPLGWR